MGTGRIIKIHKPLMQEEDSSMTKPDEDYGSQQRDTHTYTHQIVAYLLTRLYTCEKNKQIPAANFKLRETASGLMLTHVKQ